MGKFLQYYKEFDKNAKLLIILAFIGGIIWPVFTFTMSLYLHTIGYKISQIGIVGSIGVLTSAIIMIPGGVLADRYGRKKFLIIGSLITSVGVLLFLYSENIIGYCTATSVGCAGMSLCYPAFTALISEKTTNESRKYLFGLRSFAMLAGASVCMGLSGILPDILSEDVGFKTVFVITAIFASIRVLGFLFVKEDYKYRKKEKVRKIKSWRLIGLFVGTQMLIGFGAGLIVPWFQIYFKVKFDVSLANIGVLFVFTSMLIGVLMLFTPKIADEIGSVKTIVLIETLAVIALIFIPLSSVLTTAIIFYVIRTVLMNITWPVFDAFVMTTIPESERAFATGVISTLSMSLARSLGYFTGGHIMEWNLDAPFFITACVYAVSVGLFYHIFKKIDRKS